MNKSLFKRKLLFIPVLCVLWAFPCCARDFKIDIKEKINYVNVDYFDRFEDECLKYYILKAIENNNQAHIASQKSEEFRQQMKYAFGEELPAFRVSSLYAGIKFPQPTPFQGLPKSEFLLPFLGTYQPDFLLKNRDKTTSAKRAYEATKFQEQATYITLASDVATLYTNILKFNRMIELQSELAAVNLHYFLRAQKQYERGTISRILLNDSNKNLKKSEADLEDLIKNQKILLTQFAVLIGESPENINELRFGNFDNFGTRVFAPSKISSDVIFSRPDVLAAEKKLEKAKIDVRVARKEMLPSFNVLGLYTFNTIGAGNFFGWNSTFAGIFPSATQELFQGGRRIANLRINKAKYEQIFEEYKEIDLNAIKEVNDALYQLKHDDQISLKTLQQLNYEQNNYRRYEDKYKNGTISYPVLLEENIKLLTMKQNYTNLKTNQIVNNFSLYKAAGGKL